MKPKSIQDREEIRSLFDLIPARKGWRHPEFVVSGRQRYRGKLRYVAGYGHSRMYAQHMSGSVTHRILGWGDTQEEAIAMMRKKLETTHEA